MQIDLHCHSVHSDGADPAEVVARRAAQARVALFCLTDHDTCDGYPATVGSCARVLRGLELSCSENGRTVHLLVYDTAGDDHRWGRLEERLEGLRAARKERVRAICERLARLGVELDAQAIIDEATGRSVGRPDIARALVAAGAVTSRREAFDRYLSDRGEAFVPLTRLTAAEGLRLGLAAGARVSLAHPHTLGDAAVDLVARLRPQGLDGLECFYGPYTSRQRKKWLALARRHDMVITGGSDYHGADRGQLSGPGIPFPDAHLPALSEWLGIELDASE